MLHLLIVKLKKKKNNNNNNTEKNNAKGTDIVMAMYNLIEYSDNYLKHLEVYGNITKINRMII